MKEMLQNFGETILVGLVVAIVILLAMILCRYMKHLCYKQQTKREMERMSMRWMMELRLQATKQETSLPLGNDHQATSEASLGNLNIVAGAPGLQTATESVHTNRSSISSASSSDSDEPNATSNEHHNGIRG
ncbi:hypothetical protein ZHAS_00012128 [Anopheles sinensis]|uniref:Uncharacterized protein n=1 Tax=Anopheles sinensis TaxID=74873 RepID=A0A084W1Z1_ANOSI|nr:hypothetical protein ZHAS_00012128 [Anopheles sinensis]